MTVTMKQEKRLLEGYLHKTSNTLCGIKGYAGLIADRENPTDEAVRWANKIIAEVERMEEIFRSVGDLSRGRQHPDVGVDMPALVADTAREFADRNEGISVRVVSIPEGELRLPVADLALVLKEILHNSRESGTTGRERIAVEITGEKRPGGRVFLTVRDNGCGMGDKLLQQVTAPFVTTKDDHHGMGLTRIETLMEMYGLDWNIESEEGRGTAVILEVAEAL
jgi:signal transduction histidine kinase